MLALIFRPTFASCTSKTRVLFLISCIVCDSRARLSAKPRSSENMVKVHWIPLFLSKAFLVTQSRATTNSRGDTRQPCLTPVLIFSGWVLCPLCTTCAEKTFIESSDDGDHLVRHPVVPQQPPQNLSADTIEGLFKIYKVDIQGGLALDALLYNNPQCCYLIRTASEARDFDALQDYSTKHLTCHVQLVVLFVCISLLLSSSGHVRSVFVTFRCSIISQLSLLPTPSCLLLPYPAPTGRSPRNLVRWASSSSINCCRPSNLLYSASLRTFLTFFSWLISKRTWPFSRFLTLANFSLTFHQQMMVWANICTTQHANLLQWVHPSPPKCQVVNLIHNNTARRPPCPFVTLLMGEQHSADYKLITLTVRPPLTIFIHLSSCSTFTHHLLSACIVHPHLSIHIFHDDLHIETHSAVFPFSHFGKL